MIDPNNKDYDKEENWEIKYPYYYFMNELFSFPLYAS